MRQTVGTWSVICTEMLRKTFLEIAMARHDDDPVIRVAIGAAAGLVGTILIQSLLAARSRLAPESAPPMRKEPGKFMAQRTETLLSPRVRRHIPDAAESAAGKVLGLGYGMFFGAIYALLRPEAKSILGEGVALGLVCWAGGYLGWLPATGLMPPLWKQNAKQVIPPPLEHAAYGIASVAAYDQIVQRV
jgi:uncharacterized membrane protein YagU involved in acid resistance